MDVVKIARPCLVVIKDLYGLKQHGAEISEAASAGLCSGTYVNQHDLDGVETEEVSGARETGHQLN